MNGGSKLMTILRTIYLLVVVGLLTACTTTDISEESSERNGINSAISYATEETALYNGFDDIKENYTYEEALEDGCIEAYEMSEEEVLTLVSQFQEKANNGESYRVRFIMFMKDHKQDMFFQDLCYYEGKYYLFDSRSTSTEKYGFDYIKITSDQEESKYEHLLITDNMETKGEDVFNMILSSVVPVEKEEFEIVMFMPYDRPVKLSVYTYDYIDEVPVNKQTNDRIKKYMQENDIHEVPSGELECSLIHKDDYYDVRLVRVKLSYAWIDNIAVMSGDKVVAMLSGMDGQRFFITDVNNDGNDEILYHSYMGSGMLYHNLSLFDLENHQLDTYTFYNDNKDIKFEAKSDGVYIYSMFSPGLRSDEPLGKLVYNEDEFYMEEP